MQNETEKRLKNIYIFVAKGIPTWHGGEQTARGEGRRCRVVTLDGKLAAGWQRRRQKERRKQAEEELTEGRMPLTPISPHTPHLRGVDLILLIEF